MKNRYNILVALAFSSLACTLASAQTNLLLNGGFEEVNTCTEYQSECGVEAWFYLKDVQAQMLGNETNANLLGSNSFGIFYNWQGYEDFIPVIGAVLPCGLQKDHRYTFKGIIQAKLNSQLILLAGVCTGERFYVPKRPFTTQMKPHPIESMHRVPNTNFFAFEYSFIANGDERYLTFGTYIRQDTTGAKKKLIGTQTVSLVLDNFQLVPEDKEETTCIDFIANKEKIYNYNYRHKEMDYSLFGKGELNIKFGGSDSNFITRIEVTPPPAVIPDTLKLSDVLFDFNKAKLKPGAIKMLEQYFITSHLINTIDSIYIEGHTDSIGSDQRNLQLSQERCAAVEDWFRSVAFRNESGIQIHPYGKTRPVATNSSAKGRAMNRRVEIIVFRKKPL